MADVKICDRCGKELTKRSWPMVVAPYRYFLRYEAEWSVFKYDLCPKCFERFNDEFMKGSTEGSTEEVSND